jgi:hypothetical protein
MSGGPDRAKDLIDVQQLVKTAGLQRELSDRLNPDVRTKYHELWDALHITRKKYVRVWRSESAMHEAQSIDDMVDGLRRAAEELRQMQADGVTLDRQGRLVTTEPTIAEKYDMHEESEFFEYDDDDELDRE